MSEWVPAKKPQDNPKKTIHVTELSKLSSVLYHQLKADVLNHDFLNEFLQIITEKFEEKLKTGAVEDDF